MNIEKLEKSISLYKSELVKNPNSIFYADLIERYTKLIEESKINKEDSEYLEGNRTIIPFRW
jgi:chromosome condensin MukBEF MukE localization factor